MASSYDKGDVVDLSVVEAAVSELRALHRPEAREHVCITCGFADGHWPCATSMVADDLEQALRGES